MRRLRANGYEVVFCGRDERRGAALERETGAVFFRADATDRAAVDASVAFALERLGRVDLFVGNAGVLAEGPLARTTDEEFELLVRDEPHLDVPLRARAVRADARAGQRRHGADRVRLGDPRVAPHPGLFRREGRRGRRWPSCSAPREPRTASAPMPSARATRCPAWPATTRRAGGATASGAFATADDVAAAVAFLASPEAAHINGATLRIDGGTGAALQMVTRA